MWTFGAILDATGDYLVGHLTIWLITEPFGCSWL